MRTDGQTDEHNESDSRFSKYFGRAKKLTVFILCHRRSSFSSNGPKMCSVSCFRRTMPTRKCDS